MSDGCHRPAAVLGWIKGMQPEPELVHRVIAVGTANPLSEEPYVGKQRKAWHGRLLAVVRSSGHPGEIVLRAHADELPAAELRLNAQ